MRLTRATDYAVRALVTIGERAERAERAGRGARARADLGTLARELGAPSAFLGKVLQKLKRAGFLEGIRGPGGGYVLARPLEEVTVRDVVEAVEGETWLAACVSREERCPRAGRCRARPLWSRLQERLNAALESETIGALATGPNDTRDRRRARPAGTTAARTRKRGRRARKQARKQAR